MHDQALQGRVGLTASNVSSVLYHKVRAELEGLYALGRYPLSKRALLARLGAAMPTVLVETTNICNADCVFCAYQHQVRATGVMPMALFKKVIDDFVEVGGGALGLTPTVGDPLVDRQLLDRISYARSQPLITSIGMHSNMIALARFGADKLVHSGLSLLDLHVLHALPEPVDQSPARSRGLPEEDRADRRRRRPVLRARFSAG